MSDLNAKALVILEGMESPALAVAEARNIPIVKLVPGRMARRAISRLSGGAVGAPARQHGGFAEETDIALVLHTSGTTSRPKIVPLTHSQRDRLGLSYRPDALR